MKRFIKETNSVFEGNITEYFDDLGVNYVEITGDIGLLYDLSLGAVDFQSFLIPIPDKFLNQAEKYFDDPTELFGIWLNLQNKIYSDKLKSIDTFKDSLYSEYEFQLDKDKLNFLIDNIKIVYKICKKEYWKEDYHQIQEFISELSSYGFEWDEYKQLIKQDSDMLAVNLYLDLPLSNDTNYNIIWYDNKYNQWDESDVSDFEDTKQAEVIYLIYGKNIDSVDLDELNSYSE